MTEAPIGEAEEYETCETCGAVHSVYDEHEANNCVEVMATTIAALRAERSRYFNALDTIASWHENDLRFTLSDALRIAKKAIE